ncbi:MAG TPA: DUF4097 family beta strand repeat-containing protein [bacterium]|nr:DUF4097 family beta strand repeat-containing protein [bacterium]
MARIIAFSLLTALTFFPAWAAAASETFAWSGGASARKFVLANASGDVNVAVAGDEIVVTATKTAAEASDLDDVTVDVEEKGDAVHVKVKYPRDVRRAKDVRVDFDVTVPAGLGRVDVKVAGGNVTVTGVPEVEASVARGDVEIADAYKAVNVSVADGAVSVRNAALPTEKVKLNTVGGELTLAAVLPAAGAAYDLSTVSGDVSLTLLGGTDNYDIAANTVSGDVTSTLPLKKYGGLVGNSYKGKAGEGNNAIHISVVKGSVDVSTGPE